MLVFTQKYGFKFLTRRKVQMWKIFATGEGALKAIGSFFQKVVGGVMETLEMGCVAAIIIGVVQSTSGFVGYIARNLRTKAKKIELVPDTQSVGWALLFGANAGLIGTVWSIYTFTLGADLAVRTMLVTFSVVPGTIVGRLIWKDPLGAPQWLGMGVFLVAVWAMLDFPALSALLLLPVWVFATLVNTFSQVAQEALSRKASVNLTAWTNNFWVGTSTVVSCTIGLVLLWIFGDDRDLAISDPFLYGTLIMSVIVVVMISFKLLSFKFGGEIGLKKIIMYSAYLAGAAVGGVVIFGEPWTFGKTVGFLLFPVAIGLSDRKTYLALIDYFSRKTAA